jgi:hypothetical protein
MSEQPAFEWGVLTESWWRENGAACRASELQIRFACARHLGANKAKSAALAGYSGGPEALRSAGVRAEGTKAVEDLLTLAAAAESPGDADTATATEIDRKLTKLIRSPDGAISLKAIEAHQKREERRDAGLVRPTEEETIEQAARDFMALCRPGMAPLMWAEIILRGYQWHAPFIRQIVPYLAAHHPDAWGAYRTLLIGEFNQMAADVTRLESGPLLTLEQVLAAAGVGAPVTPGCAFDGGQRETVKSEAAPRSTNGAEAVGDVA